MVMSNKSLTKSQKAVLNFIVSFIETRGFAPSLTEIAGHFNHTKATAQHYVAELEKRGYLRKGKHKTRALILNEQELASMPKLGFIAAGQPIEAIENPEMITVPQSLLKKSSGQHYALEVRGNSMIEDGIRDGDVILVRHQFHANENDTVVAIILEGEAATLKTLKIKNGSAYLQPQNDEYKRIEQPFSIRGVVVGLMRQRI